MVGYLNLTTIIDRIVCDPMYGASNFGDIKYLVSKMLEMCSYEQILLAKTASLVSSDVYSKMLTYKRYASGSFSSLSNYCQYCSKPLDSALESSADSKIAEINNDLSSSVSIHHCGHSFHLICLEMMPNQKNTGCPICTSSSSSNAINTNLTNSNMPKTTKSKRKYKQTDYNENISVLNDVQPSTSTNVSPTQAASAAIAHEMNHNQFTFTENQIDALKSIRTRNLSQFKINDVYSSQMSGKNKSVNTMLEKNSKLNLAPANLANFF